jgi:hypothetical protein
VLALVIPLETALATTTEGRWTWLAGSVLKAFSRSELRHGRDERDCAGAGAFTTGWLSASLPHVAARRAREDEESAWTGVGS